MDASTRTSRAEALSREAGFVAVVNRAASRRLPIDNVDHDDMVSDAMLSLWQRGCLGWERARLSAYARKAVMPRRRTMPEVYDENPADDDFKQSQRASMMPMQELHYDAMIARGLLRALPNEERAALEILADGGDALDVSDEMNLHPAQAIEIIRRARRHAGLVDPL